MKTDTRPAKLGKTIVVAEISSEWLKLVQAEQTGRGPAITQVHLQRIDGGSDAASGVVKQAVQSCRLAKGPVIGCLPRHAVNVRLLDLPSADPKEIADMVDLQVGKQTPYSRDEIVFDYRPIGVGKEGYTRVMLVIAQRSVVRQKFHVLEEAGLDVQRMTIATEGLRNWFVAARPSADGAGELAWVVLDIDAAYTEFSVACGGEVVFSRSISIGASHLFADASGVKWKETFLQEVRRSLDGYRSEAAGRKVAGIVVTGAGPRIEGLEKDLGAAFDLEAVAVPPLQPVQTPKALPVLEDPAYRSLSIAPLIGIAIAPLSLSLDLTPDAVRLRRTLERNARNLTWLGIEIMLALMLASVFAVGRYLRKDAHLNRLRDAAAQVGREAEAVEAMRLKSNLIKERLEPKYAALTVLRELETTMPESVYLTSVQLEDRQVLLRGSTEVGSDVLKYVRALEASPVFADVKSSSSRRDFEITCSLEK